MGSNQDTVKKTIIKPIIRQTIGLIGIASISCLVTLTSCGRSNSPATSSGTTESSPLAQSSPDITTSPSADPSNSPAISPSPGSAAPLDPSLANVLDERLIVRAAQDNLFEIQAGQLAAQKATNSSVKNFAQMMVRDHTNAIPYIQRVASARVVTLPTDMGAQNKARLDRLSGLSGASFDRAYMTEIVNSHHTDVALMQNQAEQGKDQELKTQAARYLPALQAHLQTAEQILQQVNG
jgi:putative membrane protein